MANLNTQTQDIQPTGPVDLALLVVRRLVNVCSQFCYASHIFFPILIIRMLLTPQPTVLVNSHELEEGHSKGFIINGTNLFVLRHQGNLVAYLNSCPHRKVPLEWLPDQFLNSDKQFIQCATHGALFTIEQGLCISGPCHQESLTNLCVEERGGKVYCTIPRG